MNFWAIWDKFRTILCMVSFLSSVYIYLRCLKGLGNTYPNLGVLLYICRANESFHSKRGKILPSLPVSTLLYRRLVYPNFPSQTSEAVKQSPSVRMSSMESRLLRTHGGCGERLLIGWWQRKATNQIRGQRTSGNRVFTPENTRHPLPTAVPLSFFLKYTTNHLYTTSLEYQWYVKYGGIRVLG